MTIGLPKWMEEERKGDLEREHDRYKKRMQENYPEPMWALAKRQTESLKKEHTFDFLNI